MKNISINKDKNSFSIIDSYTMLPNSLRKLGISFEVDTLKTNFPYKYYLCPFFNISHKSKSPSQMVR